MTLPRKIRVLLADDSSFMRSLLHTALDPHPELEIVAACADGEEAVAAFDLLHPDVVILDINMPRMNGLEAVSALRGRDSRVPIIMCSILAGRGAPSTLEALARGATDFVAKPGSRLNVGEGITALSRDLFPKILALCATEAPAAEPGAAIPAAPPPRRSVSGVAPRLVVIGVSTGGPAALETLLPQLPGSFPLPILIVQHMPQEFTGVLAARLDSLCAVRVREAVSDARPEPGVVDIARGDWHLEIGRDFRLRLHQSAPEQFCRPSVDVLFRSAAQACPGRLLGIVLTGMGSDGLAGCRAIHAAGGAVFVQDAATSVIWGMPGSVARAGLADKVLPLKAICGEMMRFAGAAAAAHAEAVAP